eukprot:322783-Chlamydomonas_euryale.AAC.4
MPPGGSDGRGARGADAARGRRRRFLRRGTERKVWAGGAGGEVVAASAGVGLTHRHVKPTAPVATSAATEASGGHPAVRHEMSAPAPSGPAASRLRAAAPRHPRVTPQTLTPSGFLAAAAAPLAGRAAMGGRRPRAPETPPVEMGGKKMGKESGPGQVIGCTSARYC